MVRLFVVSVLLFAIGCRTTPSAVVLIPSARTGAAVQKAIDEVHRRGGGVVRLERGVYHSGTLHLRSHVELNIPEGSILMGSERAADYEDVVHPLMPQDPDEGTTKGFLVCVDSENVAVTGEGVIDGCGVSFYDTKSKLMDGFDFFAKPPTSRPRMVEFVNCRNVRFSGVTLKDSPCWTCWIRCCEGVSFEGVRVCGDQRMINNDGIDIDCCRRVRIRGCNLKTGDDCVIMRAKPVRVGELAVCEDVLVEDCDLDSACQCVRLGCPSDVLVRDIRFRSLRMRGYNGVLSGHPAEYLSRGSAGGFHLENVEVEDCDIDVSGSPISFWARSGVELKGLGGVVFRKLTVKGQEPIKLLGTNTAEVERVRFEDVRAIMTCEQPIEMSCMKDVEFVRFRVSR